MTRRRSNRPIAASPRAAPSTRRAALILPAPVLSTIINAISVSREIFLRIEACLYYRIAMTLDIMVVVVTSIVGFPFLPLTAIMILALALLDDIPIMTIAYDNVPPVARPVRWNMRRIFVLSSIMGLLAIAETFGLLLIGMHWLLHSLMQDIIALDPNQPQTMMFLQLAEGGHLLLFSVCTKKVIYEPPYPNMRSFSSIVATQIVAVPLCLFGIGVEAIPGADIVGVWIYCLVWLVIIDALEVFQWRAADRAEATGGLEKRL